MARPGRDSAECVGAVNGRQYEVPGRSVLGHDDADVVTSTNLWRQPTQVRTLHLPHGTNRSLTNGNAGQGLITRVVPRTREGLTNGPNVIRCSTT
jgi:hypothetical protein